MPRIWRAVCLLIRPHEILFMGYELWILGSWGTDMDQVGLEAWPIMTERGLDSTPLADTLHATMK